MCAPPPRASCVVVRIARVKAGTEEMGDLMKFATVAAAIAAGSLLVSSPALGDGGTFSMPTGGYKVSLPDGYCTPTGQYDAAAKIAAAADSQNLTDFSFYLCAEMAGSKAVTSWGMIKTPLETLKEKTPSRAELIGQVSSQVDPATLKALNDKASQEAQSQVHNIYGNDVKIGLDAKGVDSDSAGVYFAGTISSSDSTGTTTSAIAYSLTAAGGNVFMIYLYGPYAGASDILAVLAKVKKMTSDFVSANPG
jgi:hypothetical protein